MRTITTFCIVLVAALWVGCKQQSSEPSPTSSALLWLGVLGNPTTVNPISVALGVSNDGTVVGWSYDGSDRQRAFVWSPTTARLRDLGTLAGDAGRSMAYDISADGKVVVGWAVDGSGRRRAVRWTLADGRIYELGVFGGLHSEALRISQDGTVIVGQAENERRQMRAFRWSSAHGLEHILTEGDTCAAEGVSSDGHIVVGWIRTANNPKQAFRWTPSEGTTIIGAAATDWSETIAYDVSDDGRIIIGSGKTAKGEYRAFRWTADKGFQNLGITVIELYSMTPDGSVIVGKGRLLGTQDQALYWKNGQVTFLNTQYASLLKDGSTLVTATAISPNGRYIVGTGYNAGRQRYEAFRLDMQAQQ